MTLLDLGEVTILLLGSWGFGLAFGSKIQAIIHFFKSSI